MLHPSDNICQAVHLQEVTDAEGRRRFHGAFTGGYSAGFYNTVGSQEGWQPKTFKSSRDKRAGDRQAYGHLLNRGQKALTWHAVTALCSTCSTCSYQSVLRSSINGVPLSAMLPMLTCTLAGFPAD